MTDPATRLSNMAERFPPDSAEHRELMALADSVRAIRVRVIEECAKVARDKAKEHRPPENEYDLASARMAISIESAIRALAKKNKK